MLHPNYLQTHLLAAAHGARVRPWPLRLTGGSTVRWAPALDELRALVTERTRLIVLCNPNNPTGTCLTAAELDEVCAVAARRGAWVLSDEIYRGAERDGILTASAWGRYDRVVVTCGLSKVYGLPGLRIGWAVAPPSLCEELWSRRDFTTIAPAALSDRLARIALVPEMRVRLLARAQRRIADHYTLVRDWIAESGAGLAHVPPDAGAIVFVGYPHAIGSEELATTAAGNRQRARRPRRSLRARRISADRVRRGGGAAAHRPGSAGAPVGPPAAAGLTAPGSCGSCP